MANQELGVSYGTDQRGEISWWYGTPELVEDMVAPMRTVSYFTRYTNDHIAETTYVQVARTMKSRNSEGEFDVWYTVNPESGMLVGNLSYIFPQASDEELAKARELLGWQE